MSKIKEFLNGKNSLKSATVILAVTLLLSNFLGLIRDHFLAQKIPTDLLDIYYAAFKIPDLVFNVLILGAITAAFIPVFTSYLSQKKTEYAWQVTNSIINIAMIFLLISLVVIYLLLPKLIPLLVPNFDPERQRLTLQMARLFLISPLIFGLSYIMGAVLNSYKRFLAYSLAPLVYNLSIILSTVFWTNNYGIFAPAYGVIIGAGLHLLIQMPTVISLGWRYWPKILWRDPAIKKIGRLMLPRSIGLGSMQIMLMVYTAIASTLRPGSIAVLNLADNIQTMPTVVFATSIATAVFPTLAEIFSLKKFADFSYYIWRGIRVIFFILIPCTVIIILLRAQIVRIILGSGHFGWEQTIATANTLGYFAISLVPQGLTPLFARAFYAQHNTKTPVYIGIVSIVVSIASGFILARIMGVAGLALAFSLGSFLNGGLLYFMLRKRVPVIKNEEKHFILFLSKIFLSTIFLAAGVQLAKIGLAKIADLHFGWGVLTQALGATGVGLGLYLVLCWKFGLEELAEAKKYLFKRFQNKSNNELDPRQ